MGFAMTETCRRNQDSAAMSAEGKIETAAREQFILGLPETRRLEGFSDAAFSIIITPLVLEIHRPNALPGRLGEGLVRDWSSYLAYAVSPPNQMLLWEPILEVNATKAGLQTEVPRGAITRLLRP
jgi:Endosomal/lysosomal potassium channel TMEM175